MTDLIWMKAKTSLWHLWKMTPEGVEGRQWTECLIVIDNPVKYARTSDLKVSPRGFFRSHVCDRCDHYYRTVLKPGGIA